MPVSRTRSRALALAAALAIPITLLLPTLTAGAAPAKATPATVELQLLNIADFHGNLEPLSVNGVPTAGAATLAAYFAQERAQNPNTILFTGGDAVGASPPISSFFEDRPTIEFFNDVDMDVYAMGNHDFDAGLPRLQSQIDQAEFSYLGANLDNLDGVAPYRVLDVAGVKIAMIGLTNPEAPTLVAPGATGSIRITDPVQAAQKARAAAKREGASVFVTFGHLGVTGQDATGAATGPLVDFAQAVDGFDVIVGDHTDRQFEATINGALVTENLSAGKTYSATTLVVEPAKAKVVAKSVEFVRPVVSGITPDPVIAAKIADYRRQLQAKLDAPIGIATNVLPRSGERVGEAAIGNVTTDALRTAYGTQIAFTNGGGLRSPLPSSYAPADTTLRRTTGGYAAGPPYDLVLGDAYTLLPFGNNTLTRTVTGAQLWATLEHSVGSIPAANGKFLQISGFRFSYDATRTAGSRVTALTLDDGTAIANDPTVSITATTNDFTNSGGDGYTMLADGQGVTRDLMANVVADYLEAVGSVSPTLDGRITRIG